MKQPAWMVKVVDGVIFIPFLLVERRKHRQLPMGAGKIGAFGCKCQRPDTHKMQISGKRHLDFRRR
jgi:hypothetical protein